ncbi:hypothetical protein SAMD00023353_1001020 [Rosellinia necatrix]|uniref:Uncharacterized protein n=1 Tax=Rosellinia necatrix TaxID=77044 RepID=A0A1S8A6L7_ROSNE|nr:hypothetical protein SAMD00023353_1001020 [Rosellinia necatrix]
MPSSGLVIGGVVTWGGVLWTVVAFEAGFASGVAGAVVLHRWLRNGQSEHVTVDSSEVS